MRAYKTQSSWKESSEIISRRKYNLTNSRNALIAYVIIYKRVIQWVHD